MKFLILGASGMAGHVISIYLQEQGYDVTGFARKKLSFVNTIVGDAFDLNFLKGVITVGNYDVIVNAIGILNQQAEEKKDDAVFLNGYLPHYLATITKSMKTQIIHISTDCVFSGEKGNYTEKSLRDGEKFYDRSKAIGELEDNKNLTLRTSIIGPDINYNGVGLLNWFMKQDKVVEGYVHAIWTGQTTLQLAKTIEEAAKNHICGLYNMVPNKSINKYDLLKLLNFYLRKNSLEIIPSNNIIINKSLKRTKFDFKYNIPDYDEMILELSRWISRHKDMYSHYKV